MDEVLDNQLRREWREAHREGRKITHWLMTRDRRDRLRYEHRGQVQHPTDEPESYMGLRIYVTDDELDPPGFLLREGEPPDDLREAELRNQLHSIQRKYQQLVRPIIDELAKLEARKPPTPQLFPSTFGGITVPPQ